MTDQEKPTKKDFFYYLDKYLIEILVGIVLFIIVDVVGFILTVNYCSQENITLANCHDPLIIIFMLFNFLLIVIAIAIFAAIKLYKNWAVLLGLGILYFVISFIADWRIGRETIFTMTDISVGVLIIVSIITGIIWYFREYR